MAARQVMPMPPATNSDARAAASASTKLPPVCRHTCAPGAACVCTHCAQGWRLALTHSSSAPDCASCAGVLQME
jgi:hypothetical protein